MSYVYRHIRLDTNEVFYIGIGSDDNYRRANNTNLRSDFWKRVASISGHCVEIMCDDLSRDDALEKEKEFIQLYGRKDIGLGTLVNLTDGGNDNKGFVISDEHRKRLRESSAKRNLTPELRAKFATGKNRIKSEEERAKLSAAHKGRPKSEEHKRSLSKARTGLKISEEGRAKLSAAKKGSMPHPNCIAAARARKGIPHTIEHRKNNAIANYKFDAEKIIWIRKMHNDGLSCKKIASILGVCNQTVCNIVNKVTYKHIAA